MPKVNTLTHATMGDKGKNTNKPKKPGQRNSDTGRSWKSRHLSDERMEDHQSAAMELSEIVLLC